MDRRKFLALAGAATTAPLVSKTAQAHEITEDSPEFMGVLVDTTRCIGCRQCEVACAEANDLPVPDIKNDQALEAERTTTTSQWTVVNRYETDEGEIFAKKQCMHCGQPACAAACLTNAMEKTETGPIIWDGDKCMGCRYCMLSCPFNIPKFEYESINPKIQKCIMCSDRLEEGGMPACVEACPADALMFGKKQELMQIARVRIYSHPDTYVRHIYGEHEVGGTSWLYLSSVPFEQLGFRTDLGTLTYPDYTREFLYAV
ncbi:MAG: 4Fe-4S dicluster domain-containing protein, partial [Acidobacteriota bacterium]